MDSENCKTIDPIPATDGGANSHGGVRRSRDFDVTSSGSDKRRKLDQQEDVAGDQIEITHCRSGVDMDSPDDVASSTESASGDRVGLSPCVKRNLKLDLKAALRLEAENSMSGDGGFRETNQTSESSEICLDSDETETSSALKTNPAPSPAATAGPNSPTAETAAMTAEIDELFSDMVKKEQKRFAEKYNFDVVKEEPMEGRYQWVLLKP